MRDIKRIRRILDKLEILWDESPDSRFFQLLENHVVGWHRWSNALWNVEDDKLESVIDNAILELKNSRDE